jgi:hypothetical protein
MRAPVVALMVALVAPAMALAQGVVYEPAGEWFWPGSEWRPRAALPAGIIDWTRSGTSSWYGAPSPTIDCVAASPGLAEIVTSEFQTCDDGDCCGSASYAFCYGLDYQLIQCDTILAVGSQVRLYPAGRPDLAVTRTVTTLGCAGQCFGMNEAFPASPEAWCSQYIQVEVLGAGAVSGGGDMICNGLRSYKIATSNGASWASSLVITLNTTCEIQYPAGPPPVVTITNAGTQGSISRCVVSCVSNGVGGNGVVTLSQANHADYSGVLTLTPAASGPVACDGSVATPLKYGSTNTPVTANTPWYPSGFLGVPQSAVTLNGTSDYWSLGDVGHNANAFTVCGVAKADSITSYPAIMSKYAGAADRSWSFYRALLAHNLYVCKDNVDGACSFGTVTNVHTTGTYSVACASYLYVTDGTSVIRTNVNGTAGTPNTTAVGPVKTTTQPFLVGRWQAYYWDGQIARATYWSGWAASAAELATLVASQQTLLAQKPPGSAITLTRAATEHVCPVNGDQCYRVGHNTPGITQHGTWIGAAGGNALPTSTSAGWTGTNAAAAAAPGADGSSTSGMTITATASTGGHLVGQNYTATAVAWTASVYLKAGTKTWALVSPDTGASFAYVDTVNCALGTVSGLSARARAEGSWCRVEVTMTLTAAAYGMRIATTNGNGAYSYTDDGTGTIHAYCPQTEAGTVATPCKVTAGAPVAGVATLATAVLGGASNAPTADRWVRSVTATVTNWTNSGTTILWSVGATSATGEVTLRLTGSNISLLSYASTGSTYRVWTCLHGVSGEATKTIDVEWASSAPTIYLNRVAFSCTPSGTGPGQPTSVKTPLFLGSNSLVAANALNGRISCFREGKSLPMSKRCPLP